MAEIALERVSKRFADGTTAVRHAEFSVRDGEFFILVGPSGCGKSTLLNLIVGLEEPTEGTIRVDGEIVNGVDPRHRDMAMVFQSYAIYPHMSVRRNLAFPLELSGLPPEEIDGRVLETAALLGIADLLDRRPAQLSGGQRQRVAMGRVIVRKPRAFLMDEPLSNLDARLRVQMRAELSRLHQRLGVTTIYVTHDQTEAMTLGERIAVLLDGAIQQIGTPRELYARPANLFVAGFIGAPPMNLLPARQHRGCLIVPGGELEPPTKLRGRLDEAPETIVVGIRPEGLLVPEGSTAARDEAGEIEATVEVAEWLGADLFAHFGLPAPDDALASIRREPPARDALPEPLRLVARLDPGVALRPGQRIRLRPDPSRLLLFDPRSGRAIDPGEA